MYSASAWRATRKTAAEGNCQQEESGFCSYCRIIKSILSEEAALIITDQALGYSGIADKETLHATVNHWQKEYVRGIVHTNTLENVWSLFKRSVMGSYHQVSAKHLDRYLDEFEFRFNNRNNLIYSAIR